MERPRFFSLQQKREHRETVGDNCEAYISKGERCPEVITEADHIIPYSKGGETDSDNLQLLGLICHSIKHFLDGEVNSARLVKRRMNKEQQEELKKRGFFF